VAFAIPPRPRYIGPPTNKKVSSIAEGLRRTPPSESPSEAVERLLPRWQLRLLPGDVVVAREPIPKVNPRPLSKEPQWRYRVSVHPEPQLGQTFTMFLHAASRAEELAVSRRTRIMFVEDDVPALLADYRRQA
jgi:hypothetical protein